jgi:hypothetical protein
MLIRIDPSTPVALHSGLSQPSVSVRHISCLFQPRNQCRHDQKDGRSSFFSSNQTMPGGTALQFLPGGDRFMLTCVIHCSFFKINPSATSSEKKFNPAIITSATDFVL